MKTQLKLHKSRVGRFLLSLVALGAMSRVQAQTATPTFTLTPTPLPASCCTSTWFVSGLNDAQDVRIDANNFYICDTFNGKFSIYSKSAVSPVSSPVSSIANTNATPNLVNPSGVALDGQGHIFVSDMGTGYVYEFNNDGVYAQLAAFNGTGGAVSVSGIMNVPRSIWVNNAGTTVVAADAEGHEIRVFQKQGAAFVPVLKLTQPSFPSFYPFGVTDDGSYLYFSDTAYNVVWKYPIDFSGPAQAITLTGLANQARRIARDTAGNFYVTDDGAGYVVYEPINWNVVYKCSTVNGGSYNQPEGIAVDVDGRVYLSDGYNGRALRMEPCGVSYPTFTPTPTATPPYSGADPPGAGECFVYPSPATGNRLTVAYQMTWSGKAQIKLWNWKGGLTGDVSEQKSAGVQTTVLDISALASGVYFYSVTLQYDSGSVDTIKPHKFVIIH